MTQFRASNAQDLIDASVKLRGDVISLQLNENSLKTNATINVIFNGVLSKPLVASNTEAGYFPVDCNSCSFKIERPSYSIKLIVPEDPESAPSDTSFVAEIDGLRNPNTITKENFYVTDDAGNVLPREKLTYVYATEKENLNAPVVSTNGKTFESSKATTPN